MHASDRPCLPLSGHLVKSPERKPYMAMAPNKSEHPDPQARTHKDHRKTFLEAALRPSDRWGPKIGSVLLIILGVYLGGLLYCGFRVQRRGGDDQGFRVGFTCNRD